LRDYLKRLAELASAGFLAGAGTYVAQNGFELTQAGARGLLVAGGLAAYGLVVKGLGDKERPTVK
jgi:hypothetical protein